MKFRLALLALYLLAAPSACTAQQNNEADATLAQDSKSEEGGNPLTGFERMVGGEWKMTAQSGTSMYDTWHWGPGKHSLRVMTDGEGADGNPWRSLQVVYWHPGLKQVRTLGLSPYEAGVSEGTTTLDGDSGVAVVDMYQNPSHRKLSWRMVFDGPDKYHSTLLESVDGADYEILSAWDYFRMTPRPAAFPDTAAWARVVPDRLKAFAGFVGHTWETRGEGVIGDTIRAHSAVELIPLAGGVYARTSQSNNNGETSHLFDSYFYRHTGTGALRCLALSEDGSIYEGDVTVLDNGELRLNLTGYGREGVVPYDIRIEFKSDGTTHQRVWSLEADERMLILVVHHKKIDRPRN